MASGGGALNFPASCRQNSRMPGSRGRIFAQARNCAVEFDLVVVAAGGEGRELGEIVGEPGSLFGQEDEAVFDHRRLRVEAHDLVAVGGKAGDMRNSVADQVLDELGPRGAVLDHDRLGLKQPVLLDNRPPELRVGELLAQDVHEIEARAFHAPGGADGIVGKLAWLVGGVPALHHAVEGRRIGEPEALEPGRLDQAATGRRGPLLVLGGEIHLPDG